MSVLVDTSAIYALLDRNDRNHAAAGAWLATARDEALVTHSYVVVESMALAQRRLGGPVAARAARDLLPVMAVTYIDEPLHAAAMAAFVAAPEGAVSLVDRVSFELMRREGIGTAFAFDADFARAGYALVPD